MKYYKLEIPHKSLPNFTQQEFVDWAKLFMEVLDKQLPHLNQHEYDFGYSSNRKLTLFLSSESPIQRLKLHLFLGDIGLTTDSYFTELAMRCPSCSRFFRAP